MQDKTQDGGALKKANISPEVHEQKILEIKFSQNSHKTEYQKKLKLLKIKDNVDPKSKEDKISKE